MRKTFFSIVIAMILMITACGTKLYTDGNAQGYTSIDDIDGVLFSMYSKTVGSATAVTNISENMNFERNQTYLYKNGKSEYLLFNISSVVLAVEKGTAFNMANTKDKAEAVTSHDLLGIWFDIPKKRIDYTDNTANGVYKFVATVNGEVSVTSDIFNDFAGKLVVLSDGTDEWSLFIGSVGTDFDSFSSDVKETINYIAASLKMAEETNEPETAAVSLGGSTIGESVSSASNSTVVSDEPISESSIDDSEESADAASEENSQEKCAKEESDCASRADSTDSTEEVVVQDDSSLASSSQDEIEIIEENVVATNRSTEETTDMVQEEFVENEHDPREVETQEPKRGESIELNNQKEDEKDDSTIYDSSVYDMLRIGNWGYADIQTGKTNEKAAVKLSSLYTGNDATNIIQKACADKIVPYSYFEAPSGCSWHLVKIENQGINGYLDVKFIGADGNKLNFRGIKYSKRTYMLNCDDGMYVYYAVPNGCSEYVLEVGDGTIDNELNSAYYLINEF